jgi:hypothetical protein
MAGRGHDKARVLELVMRGAVHKTTIVPHHHAATLITTGVLSRFAQPDVHRAGGRGCWRIVGLPAPGGR